MDHPGAADDGGTDACEQGCDAAECAAALYTECTASCNNLVGLSCLAECHPLCVEGCTEDPAAFTCGSWCTTFCQSSCPSACAEDENPAKCEVSCTAACAGQCSDTCADVATTTPCDKACEPVIDATSAMGEVWSIGV